MSESLANNQVQFKNPDDERICSIPLEILKRYPECLLYSLWEKSEKSENEIILVPLDTIYISTCIEIMLNHVIEMDPIIKYGLNVFQTTFQQLGLPLPDSFTDYLHQKQEKKEGTSISTDQDDNSTIRSPFSSSVVNDPIPVSIIPEKSSQTDSLKSIESMLSILLSKQSNEEVTMQSIDSSMKSMNKYISCQNRDEIQKQNESLINDKIILEEENNAVKEENEILKREYALISKELSIIKEKNDQINKRNTQLENKQVDTKLVFELKKDLFCLSPLPSVSSIQIKSNEENKNQEDEEINVYSEINIHKKIISILSLYNANLVNDYTEMSTKINDITLACSLYRMTFIDSSINYISITNPYAQLYLKCSHFIVFSEKVLEDKYSLFSSIFSFYSIFNEFNIDIKQLLKQSSSISLLFPYLKTYINEQMCYFASRFSIDTTLLSIIKNYDLYINIIHDTKDEIYKSILELHKYNLFPSSISDLLNQDVSNISIVYTMLFPPSLSMGNLNYNTMLYSLFIKINNQIELTSDELKQCCFLKDIYTSIEPLIPGSIYKKSNLLYEYEIRINTTLSDVQSFILLLPLPQHDIISLLCPFKRIDIYRIIYNLFEVLLKNKDQKEWLLKHMERIQSLSDIPNIIDIILKEEFDAQVTMMNNKLIDKTKYRDSIALKNNEYIQKIRVMNATITKQANEIIEKNKQILLENQLLQNIHSITQIESLYYHDSFNNIIDDLLIPSFRLSEEELYHCFSILQNHQYPLSNNETIGNYFKIAYVYIPNTVTQPDIQICSPNMDPTIVSINHNKCTLISMLSMNLTSSIPPYLYKYYGDYCLYVIILPFSTYTITVDGPSDSKIEYYYYNYRCTYSLQDLYKYKNTSNSIDDILTIVCFQLMFSFCRTYKYKYIVNKTKMTKSMLTQIYNQQSTPLNKERQNIQESFKNEGIALYIYPKKRLLLGDEYVFSIYMPSLDDFSYIRINRNNLTDEKLQEEMAKKLSVYSTCSTSLNDLITVSNEDPSIAIITKAIPEITCMIEYQNLINEYKNCQMDLIKQNKHLEECNRYANLFPIPSYVKPRIFLPKLDHIPYPNKYIQYILKDCVVILGETRETILLPKDTLFQLPDFIIDYHLPQINIPIINPYQYPISIQYGDSTIQLTSESIQLALEDNFYLKKSVEKVITLITKKCKIDIHFKFNVISNKDILYTSSPCAYTLNNLICCSSTDVLNIYYMNQIYQYNKINMNMNSMFFLNKYRIQFDTTITPQGQFFLDQKNSLTSFVNNVYMNNIECHQSTFIDKDSFINDLLSNDLEKYIQTFNLIPIYLCFSNDNQQLVDRIYQYLIDPSIYQRYIPEIQKKIISIQKLVENPYSLQWKLKYNA
ncbi:hypothetical protein WA158_007785 [Blastocystis sp. Blastoise]